MVQVHLPLGWELSFIYSNSLSLSSHMMKMIIRVKFENIMECSRDPRRHLVRYRVCYGYYVPWILYCIQYICSLHLPSLLPPPLFSFAEVVFRKIQGIETFNNTSEEVASLSDSSTTSSDGAADPILRTGLRTLVRSDLDRICMRARCTILSQVSNKYLDAYVLSESSLFVYPYMIVLKTCG